MKYVTIIHPFSSARYLADELRNQGLASLGVLTVPHESIMEYIRPDPEWFDAFLYLPNASEQAVQTALMDYDIAWILNGAEATTHLTDTLMHAIMPDFANNPDTSALRSNKYLAQEALAQYGMPAIRQEKVEPATLSVDMLKNFQFPVYCKPVHGLATMGGFRAENPQEVVDTMRRLSEEIRMFDASEYLVQEFVEGEEFVVDTFSYQGQHAVSSVHRYVKELHHNTPLYRYIEIVRDQTLWARYTDYVRECLDITGLQNGFAHTEAFHCPHDELKLIEINPRISGVKGYYNKAAKCVNLKTQVDLLASALNDDLRGSQWEDITQSARVLTLYNFSQDPLRDPHRHLESLQTLVTWSLLSPVGLIGQEGLKTLADVDLLVLLASDDHDLLEAETRELFALEQSGVLL